MEDEPTVETAKLRAMATVTGTSPFEVLLLLAAIYSSVTHLFGYTPAPSSIEDSLPVWAIYLWYGALGIGSVICLYGGLRPRKVLPGEEETRLRTGLVQYAIGWMYVGTACLTYGVAVLLLFPGAGAIAGTTTTAWGVASLIRAFQVRKLLRLRGGGKHKHAR